MPIPRRIIQTGKSRELPPLARASATNLQLLHPDWEYLYFDDGDVDAFISAEYSQYRSLFETFPHRIQRFDFFRYLAVLKMGGFYFDTDVLLSDRLEELLAHDAVFPFEEITLNRYLRKRGIDWELGNYGFGAAPGNPFLDAAVANCVRSQQEASWAREMLDDIPFAFRSDFEVLYTTGPGMLTRTLAECPDVARDVTVLFPADACDPIGWHQFGTYGTHLMEGSWRMKSNWLARRLGWLWAERRQRRLLVASRGLGPTRRMPGAPEAGRAQLDDE